MGFGTHRIVAKIVNIEKDYGMDHIPVRPWLGHSIPKAGRWDTASITGVLRKSTLEPEDLTRLEELSKEIDELYQNIFTPPWSQ